MTHTALMFDISGKQKYIFSTNALQSIVGASARLDMLNKEFSTLFENELVYSGGGNGLAVFANDNGRLEEARKFLHSQAATLGLSIPFVEQPSANNSDTFSWEELDKIKTALAEVKRHAHPIPPPFAIPMGSQCQLCGKGTALATKTMGRRACQRCQAKLKWLHPNADHGADALHAHDWLAKEYADRGAENLFLLNLSNMGDAAREWRRGQGAIQSTCIADSDIDPSGQGNSEGKSLIAVICFDANGMGGHIESLRGKSVDNKETPKTALGGFSKSIDAIVRSAVTAAMREVFGDPSSLPAGVRLPFRPLVVAGDDITAVISPEMAWPFSVEVASRFESLATAHGFHNLTLSAGLAIVHASFPVSEAVALAEELLANAKKGGKRHAQTLGHAPAMLDFEMLLDAKLEPLEARRRRECEFLDADSTPHRKRILTGRPYPLIQAIDGWPSIQDIIAKARRLSSLRMARSKIKELRDILRDGEAGRGQRLLPFRRDRNWRDLEALITWNLPDANHPDISVEPLLDIIDLYAFIPKIGHASKVVDTLMVSAG